MESKQNVCYLEATAIFRFFCHGKPSRVIYESATSAEATKIVLFIYRVLEMYGNKLIKILAQGTSFKHYLNKKSKTTVLKKSLNVQYTFTKNLREKYN